VFQSDMAPRLNESCYDITLHGERSGHVRAARLRVCLLNRNFTWNVYYLLKVYLTALSVAQTVQRRIIG
jgi:hypothetical protein